MKIKILIPVVIAVLVVSIISSCKPKCKGNGGDREYLVPEDRRIKLNEGDTLIFKTENDAFDTLTVTYAGSYMHSDYYECDNGILYLRKIEEYSVSFENTNLNADINSIRVAQIGSTNDIRITHFFMSVYVDRTLLDGYIKDSYTYNDSTYYDVNVVENDSILIYINHTHGILAYKYKEQDMYNLHKSIRSSKK